MEQIKRKMAALRDEKDHAIEERDNFEEEKNATKADLDKVCMNKLVVHKRGCVWLCHSFKWSASAFLVIY